MLDKKDIEPFRQKFKELDHDQTGFINSSELKKAMIETDLEHTEAEIEAIIKEVDH